MEIYLWICLILFFAAFTQGVAGFGSALTALPLLAIFLDIKTAIPLDQREIVTVQELTISNMLEIGALRELLFKKGIIGEEEFIDRYKKLDREMKERQGRS
jgi:hypothetical protein